jgi:hypothetical protein
MIVKEYGKYFGACDCCQEETTPIFRTWDEVRDYMRFNHWKTSKNKETGEWENLCPECKKLDNIK